MPVTRDVLEAIHQRRSSANPGSDLFATINPNALTAAESAAGVTPVDFSYPPGHVLRYGQNSAPGTTDMTAAFVADVNQHLNGGPEIYAPAGSYLVSANLPASTNVGFSFRGDGVGKTFITQTVDADIFTVICGGSSFNQVTIEGVTLIPNLVMASGNGISIINDGQIPSVILRDIQVLAGAGNHFLNDILLNDCGEGFAENVICYGDSTSYGVGFRVISSGSPGGSATVFKYISCRVYNKQFGWVYDNETNPGLEGPEWYGCAAVAVATGLLYVNGTSGYSPPDIKWIGGHINASGHCISISKASQLHVHDATFYNNGSAEFISCTTVGDTSITDNIFINEGSGAVSGITLGATSIVDGGMIADNIFRLGATGAAAINIDAAHIQNLFIRGNTRTGGNATVTVLAGTLDGSVVIEGNTPDDIDLYDATLTFAATLSLVGKRANFFSLGNPGGATTLTALTPRRARECITLQMNSTNDTVQHNATANGFALAGSVNYLCPAGGGRLTLLYVTDFGYWVEIGRG